MAKGQTDFVKSYERHKYANKSLSKFNIYDPNFKKDIVNIEYIYLFSLQVF